MNYDFSVLSDIDFEQMVNKLLNGKTRESSYQKDLTKTHKDTVWLSIDQMADLFLLDLLTNRICLCIFGSEQTCIIYKICS